MILEIISPEKIIFTGEVDSVAVPGVDGEFEMLNNHAAIVSNLKKGSIKVYGNITLDDSQKEIFLDSLNFEFYREAAVNFGFLIDKNIPWRLNYDLSSPVNRDKLSRGKTESPVDAYLSRYFYEISIEAVSYTHLRAHETS